MFPDMIGIFKGAVFGMQFLFFPSLSFLFVYPIFADMTGIFKGAVFEKLFPIFNVALIPIFVSYFCRYDRNIQGSCV